MGVFRTPYTLAVHLFSRFNKLSFEKGVLGDTTTSDSCSKNAATLFTRWLISVISVRPVKFWMSRNMTDACVGVGVAGDLGA